MRARDAWASRARPAPGLHVARPREPGLKGVRYMEIRNPPPPGPQPGTRT